MKNQNLLFTHSNTKILKKKKSKDIKRNLKESAIISLNRDQSISFDPHWFKIHEGDMRNNKINGIYLSQLCIYEEYINKIFTFGFSSQVLKTKIE